MTQDVELVGQDLGLRRMGLHRVAEGLPHIHHRQANAGGLLRPQSEKADPDRLRSVPAPRPDRASALQVADLNAIRVALLDRQLIHANDLWRWLGSLGRQSSRSTFTPRQREQATHRYSIAR